MAAVRELVEQIDGSVLVLWSPGLGRSLAHRLIVDTGLVMLDSQTDDARVTHHCGVCGSSEHGRPVLIGLPGTTALHVSISYAGDLTVVALTGAGPVGVDIELADVDLSSGFGDVVATHGESAGDARSSVVTWVRKESLLKATGRGLTVDPREIRLTASDQPPALVSWADSHLQDEQVFMCDLEITRSHVAAVSVLTPDRPQMIVRKVAAAASSEPASD